MNEPQQNPSWLDMGDDEPAAPHSPAPQPPVPPQHAPQPQGPFVPQHPQQTQPTQQAPFPPNAPGSVDEVALLRRAKHAPAKGWRRAVYKASGGSVNLGDSPADVRHAELVRAVQQPIRGDYRIAVLSLKGGVGKTTTSIGLGATLASTRGDRVIAIDANPDLGTLAQRVPQQTQSTVRDLIADKSVTRYSDVRAHTSQAQNRLEVLSSERDPARAEAFSESDYRQVMDILRRHYNIIITDCGTGVSHSAMGGVLGYADALVLVTSPAIDGARSGTATLEWLSSHGYTELATSAVVAVCSSRSGSASVDVDRLAQHFLNRTRAVHQIPFDAHLAEGAEVELDLMHKKTRQSFMELAATIAGGFPNAVHRN